MSRHPSRDVRSPFYVKNITALRRSKIKLLDAANLIRSVERAEPNLTPIERKALLDYAGSCHAIRDGLAKLIGGEHEQVSDAMGGAAVSGARVGDDWKGV